MPENSEFADSQEGASFLCDTPGNLPLSDFSQRGWGENISMHFKIMEVESCAISSGDF